MPYESLPEIMFRSAAAVPPIVLTEPRIATPELVLPRSAFPAALRPMMLPLTRFGVGALSILTPSLLLPDRRFRAAGEAVHTEVTIRPPMQLPPEPLSTWTPSTPLPRSASPATLVAT